MKINKLLILGLIVLLFLGGALMFRHNRNISLREEFKIAVDAYIYGYPLVTFDMARRQQTNVAESDAEHAPMGQMIKMRNYPAEDNHCCAAPNADTLYTIAWLDLSREPWIFSIPDMGDRYYILPMLDGFSEVFKVISSSSNGGQAGTYAITGPGWKGTLPEGVVRVASPTAMVWILGRIYCNGTQEDYGEVRALQDMFSLVPLSSHGKPYTPPPGVVDTDFDMRTSVRDQVNNLDIHTYFNYLARLMKANPPKPQDGVMVDRMAKIGLVPGKDFDPSKISSLKKEEIKTESRTALEKTGVQVSSRPHFAQGIGWPRKHDLDTEKLGFLENQGLKVVPKVGLLEMALLLKQQETTNGWLYFTEGVGNFGTDYLLRGMANLLGPGWNRPEDAVYPLSMEDAQGNDYNGAKHNYTMRFEKGGMPPVDGFWSLTMYDEDLFFVPNPIDRYALSQRDTFITNPDGSIDLYLQAESPGSGKEANWLPAPKGKFKLVLRLYGPVKSSPTILDNSWVPPPVKKAGPAGI